MAVLYNDEYTVINAQHTDINGLPAYFISYTYDVDGETREGAAVYLVVGGYGFELRSFASPTSMEIFREVINHIFESFKLLQPQ